VEAALDGALDVHEMLELADEAPETLLALFETRGWGDGLPLVPPTPERVATMLAGRDADEVVGIIPPRFGRATRRALAVNAVLAGARPEVLPVIETAVRALCRPEVNLQGVQSTTHPVAPLVVVHGDAVERLGFNAGTGTFGPGCRANATVGRALRLVLMHVGGAYPGRGDQATQGQPSKYAFCIAEVAPPSPWRSYPQSVGVDAASAVTVACCENPHNVHDMESETAERILLKAASTIASLGSNDACISQGEIFVALCPEHAATIVASGWSRRDVQLFLYERARLTRGQFLDAFRRRRWAAWMQAEGPPELLLPMTEDPDHYRVVVAGGPGKHSAILPSWGMTKSVTLALPPC
jgi:hypothetical protein